MEVCGPPQLFSRYSYRGYSCRGYSYMGLFPQRLVAMEARRAPPLISRYSSRVYFYRECSYNGYSYRAPSADFQVLL
jgi:hypothetical protein